MVKLQELAVGLLALLVAEGEIALRLARQPGLLLQVIEIGGMSVRPGAVGSACRFQLQGAQIDTQLNDLPAVVRLNKPRLRQARLVFPIIQNEINVRSEERRV